MGLGKQNIFLKIMGLCLGLSLSACGVDTNAHQTKLDKGWCTAEDRFLSNDEVINKAINYLVKYRSQSPAFFVKSNHNFDATLPTYNNVKEFRLKNQACCRQVVFPENPEKYLKNFDDKKIATYPNGLFFYFRILEGNDPFKPLRSTSFGMTACGKILGATDHNNQKLKFIEKLVE